MQKELLSAYMDGEQVNNELTAELCNNAELKKSWESFHSIRAVMRKETPVFLSADFTAKMEALIDAEPTLVNQPMPEEAIKSPFVQKLKAMFSPLTQVAVAAAVCLIAVFGVQTFTTKTTDTSVDSPVLQTMPFITNAQQVSYNAPVKDVFTTDQAEQKTKRLEAKVKNLEEQQHSHSLNEQP